MKVIATVLTFFALVSFAFWSWTWPIKKAAQIMRSPHRSYGWAFAVALATVIILVLAHHLLLPLGVPSWLQYLLDIPLAAGVYALGLKFSYWRGLLALLLSYVFYFLISQIQKGHTAY